jgi:hypothetical protein
LIETQDGTPIFGGELHGRVLPSETTWLIAEDDPTSPLRGKRLVLAFSKAYYWCDIWASFLRMPDTGTSSKQSEYI